MYSLGISVPGGLTRISLITTCPRRLGAEASKHQSHTRMAAHFSPLLLRQNSINQFSRSIGMPALSQWIALTNHTAGPCQRRPNSGAAVASANVTIPLNLVLKTPGKFEQKPGFRDLWPLPSSLKLLPGCRRA